jgi:hypothetical protein
MKYLKLFTLGIATGAILNLIDLSFWLEVGIASIMAIVVMIIFRNKL